MLSVASIRICLKPELTWLKLSVAWALISKDLSQETWQTLTPLFLTLTLLNTSTLTRVSESGSLKSILLVFLGERKHAGRAGIAAFWHRQKDQKSNMEHQTGQIEQLEANQLLYFLLHLHPNVCQTPVDHANTKWYQYLRWSCQTWRTKQYQRTVTDSMIVSGACHNEDWPRATMRTSQARFSAKGVRAGIAVYGTKCPQRNRVSPQSLTKITSNMQTRINAVHKEWALLWLWEILA